MTHRPALSQNPLLTDEEERAGESHHSTLPSEHVQDTMTVTVAATLGPQNESQDSLERHFLLQGPSIPLDASGFPNL